MSTNQSNINPNAVQAGGQLSFFERYLTLWVFLCIIAGIVLGRVFPGIAVTLDCHEPLPGVDSHRHLPLLHDVPDHGEDRLFPGQESRSDSQDRWC
jgi:hypothetical protein